jgi:hypothetical protein
MRRVLLVAGFLMVVAAGLALMAPANAQTTRMELRNGEVLAVDGNVVTVRGPQGVKQFVIPEGFQFEMDGRKLSVHDLKPGMKYSAMITTTEAPIDVTTTDVREGEVVYTAGNTVVVRDLDTREIKKFTSEELKSRNLVLYVDGKQTDPASLRKGDRITATIVTKYPPKILTEQDLKVFVAQPPPPPPAPKPAPAPVAAPAPPPPPPPPAKLPKTGSPLPLVGLSGVVLLGLGISVGALRRLLTRG